MLWTLLMTLATPASACGGLFCDTQQPVVQNAERIVFDLDRETGIVETHVQISYEGPARDFAWVVPVANEPELFTSSQTLFDTLALQTAPQFVLDRVQEGDCRADNQSVEVADSSSSEFGAPDEPSASGEVSVVSQGQVGPYDFEVLLAESSKGLVRFLELNAYEVPAGLQPLLDPYITTGAHFVALKLSKDRDAGDIAPLGMRYAGVEASIPIQLTAVAAADDLRLEVYVFADVRAVPRTYLHVQINEAAIDWWRGGQNYADVITQAADEAGGRAFATDYFMAPPAGFEVPAIVPELMEAPTGRAWVTIASSRLGLPITESIANIIATAAGLPPEVDGVDFVNCPECYDDLWNSGADFDVLGATSIYEEEVIEPLDNAASLFDRRRLTRMTSSLSASEMVVDPVFTPNRDMDDEADFVSNVRRATQVWECGSGKRLSDAPRRLDLSDGRSIALPSERWMRENGTTEFELLEDLGAIKAQVVERTSSKGEPEIVRDHTGRLFDLVTGHNASLRGLLESCGGCQVGGASSFALCAFAFGLVGLRRRR